jgi:hypothetical protein
MMEKYLTFLVKENRIGIFKITQTLLENISRKRINAIFKDVIITHAKSFYHNKQIEYAGYSIHFEAIKEGDKIPVYTFECEIDKNYNIVKSKWVKVEGEYGFS